MSPCSGTKHSPAGKPSPPMVGEMGLMKIHQVSEEPYDVYGEITDILYPFSTHPVLYVDVRDAAYLLGKEFVLA